MEFVVLFYAEASFFTLFFHDANFHLISLWLRLCYSLYGHILCQEASDRKPICDQNQYEHIREILHLYGFCYTIHNRQDLEQA